MSYPYVIMATELESFNTYDREGPPVGTRMVVEDGRIYRFAQAGAADLIVGNLHQAVLWDLAKWGDQAVATAAVGATVLTGVDSTGDDMAASKLKYGYTWIDSAAYKGPAMRVKDNIKISDGAATGTITLFNPVQLAITTSTHQIAYGMNPWRDVVIGAGPSTAMQVGVCVEIIEATDYGWLQTGGASKALVVGTVLEADIVVGSATTDGCVMPSAAFITDGPEVGVCHADAADGTHCLVHLTLDS